jgi:hypothetical protein
MKKFLLFIITLSFAYSCNTYKRAQKDIYSGNFDQALDGMIKKYAKGNIKEKDIQRWAGIFNDAYSKANNQNIDQIYHSQNLTEGSEKYRTIYNNYVSLQSRYDKLKPYLPIRVNSTEVAIKHENYFMQLEHARLKLADALYTEGEFLLKSNDKLSAREAYGKYAEIAQLMPSYPMLKDRMELAYQKGLTHILITVNNDSRSILPRNLHHDLTYLQMDNTQFFWQKFHNQPNGAPIDYYVELNFKEIAVSPEFIDRKSNKVERVWIDSSEFRLNAEGQKLRDSLGRPIKNYTKQKAVCKTLEIFQKKSVAIQSEFIVLDAQQRLISRISPVNSHFDFENISYKIDGDESALDDKFLRKIKCSQFLPFPNDEQMVFDCGQDLKLRFSQFLASESRSK